MWILYPSPCQFCSELFHLGFRPSRRLTIPPAESPPGMREHTPVPVQSLEMEQEGSPQLSLAQSIFQTPFPIAAPPVSQGPCVLWCLGLFQSLGHVLIKTL